VRIEEIREPSLAAESSIAAASRRDLHLDQSRRKAAATRTEGPEDLRALRWPGVLDGSFQHCDTSYRSAE
jgi:hypothetical protein